MKDFTQKIPAIVLVAILFALFPLSMQKNAVLTESKPVQSKKELLAQWEKTSADNSIEINGRKYDGFEKYAYVQAAMKMGQRDIESPPRRPQYKPGQFRDELSKAKANKARSRTASVNATFTERGPSNIPGRTRSIVVDASDPSEQTWFAGSIGGGIWRTTDAGQSWEELTAGLPNLAIASMAQSFSNPNVLYAGTGEKAFTGISASNGAGLLKSVDNGETWSFLASTTGPTFVNINRVIVDPSDENILLISTMTNKFVGSDPDSNRIYKSSDGGETWEEVYSSDLIIAQLIADPNDFSKLYAALNGGMIVKSMDGGDFWSDPIAVSTIILDEENLSAAGGGSRVELAIAPQNTDIIYASLNTGLSDLYVSFDAGESWVLAEQANVDRTIDWLGGQGDYDNTIMVSPLNDSIVYIGGVAMEQFKLGTVLLQDSVKALETIFSGTDEIIEVFQIIADDGKEIDLDEFTSIEVRFGQTQLAHRFTVPSGSTSGVPDNQYTYQDYVEVPFQVWDTDNDVQLMASFRDNNGNGVYDLDDNFDSSREYIWANQVPYIDRRDENIGKNGSHNLKASFLLWLTTPNGVVWDEALLVDATISLNLQPAVASKIRGVFTSVGNPYPFQGPSFQGPNDLRVLHPDHHQMFPINVGTESFTILNANDGGVYLSDTTDLPGTIEGAWFLRGSGYNSTTYYGADKSPMEDRYFAGAQDQGTHLSGAGEIADAKTEYVEAIGGDGFETIWHSTDPDQLIGGSQFNGIERSDDGGESFVPADFGLQGDGPFVTRLSNSFLDPDLLFAIGAQGVYRSSNFGRNWTYSVIDDSRWSFWSAADVEVALADPQIVWAGGEMSVSGNEQNIFVSQDGGFTFEATNNYGDQGLATGIYSHPFDRATAFVLFGAADQAKVLRTTDMGQTWQDLTKFDLGESTNGFPDVSAFSLLVMPFDTNVIWVGTDIGIVESMDGGETWALLDAPDFRAVSVWDMKIKGDQVVIATHGRGVWTATIPELLEAPEVDVVLAPVLSSLGQSTEEFSMLVNAELRANYDTVEVFLNDIVVEQVFGNDSIGAVTFNLPLIETGDYTVRIEARKNGIEYRTSELSIVISPFFPTADSYSNEFEEANDDFTLDRFTIGSASGFGSDLLQTVHPYPEGSAIGTNEVNLIARLNIPIRVASEDASIRFREVVLVEKGADGESFGDADFWDYVIVEGSINGSTWIPLLDGYDSNDNDTWSAAFDGGSNGREDLFVTRTIDLLETFNPGDVVQLRFRLFSDPFSAGWGWGIDDLYIQEEPVISGLNSPEIASKVSIYPNPSFGTVNLELNNVLKGDVALRVLDFSGRNMLQLDLRNSTGTYKERLDFNTLPMGIYVIELSNGTDRVTQKLLKF